MTFGKGKKMVLIVNKAGIPFIVYSLFRYTQFFILEQATVNYYICL